MINSNLKIHFRWAHCWWIESDWMSKSNERNILLTLDYAIFHLNATTTTTATKIKLAITSCVTRCCPRMAFHLFIFNFGSGHHRKGHWWSANKEISAYTNPHLKSKQTQQKKNKWNSEAIIKRTSGDGGVDEAINGHDCVSVCLEYICCANYENRFESPFQTNQLRA